MWGWYGGVKAVCNVVCNPLRLLLHTYIGIEALEASGQCSLQQDALHVGCYLSWGVWGLV